MSPRDPSAEAGCVHLVPTVELEILHHEQTIKDHAYLVGTSTLRIEACIQISYEEWRQGEQLMSRPWQLKTQRLCMVRVHEDEALPDIDSGRALQSICPVRSVLCNSGKCQTRG
jgi:hypothetical protein